MNTIILILLALSLVGCGILLLYNQHIRREAHSLAIIINNMANYAFLIDDKVNVCLTNYYKLNPDAEKIMPQILGNVLRCKNGCDAGMCGTHPLCAHCAIRSNIVKSFTEKNSFTNIEASMRLYTINNEALATDVMVSGKYVEIDKKPFMVVTVKDVTALKAIRHELQVEKQTSEKLKVEKTNFMKNMEVQLRNPLNAIIGFSQMLSTAETEEKRNHCLKLINEYNNILVNQFNEILHNSDNRNVIMEMEESQVSNQELESDHPNILPVMLCSVNHEEDFIELQNQLKNYYQLEKCEEGNELLSNYLLKQYAGIIIDAELADVNAGDLADALISINKDAKIYVLARNEKAAESVKNHPFTAILYSPVTEQVITHYFG